MSLRIRFRFDGRCSMHPRYNPEKDGSPPRDCEGCEALYVIHLYCAIARKKARSGEGTLIVRSEVHPEACVAAGVAEEDGSLDGPETKTETEDGSATT